MGGVDGGRIDGQEPGKVHSRGRPRREAAPVQDDNPTVAETHVGQLEVAVDKGARAAREQPGQRLGMVVDARHRGGDLVGYQITNRSQPRRASAGTAASRAKRAATEGDKKRYNSASGVSPSGRDPHRKAPWSSAAAARIRRLSARGQAATSSEQVGRHVPHDHLRAMLARRLHGQDGMVDDAGHPIEDAGRPKQEHAADISRRRARSQSDSGSTCLTTSRCPSSNCTCSSRAPDLPSLVSGRRQATVACTPWRCPLV